MWLTLLLLENNNVRICLTLFTFSFSFFCIRRELSFFDRNGMEIKSVQILVSYNIDFVCFFFLFVFSRGIHSTIESREGERAYWYPVWSEELVKRFFLCIIWQMHVWGERSVFIAWIFQGRFTAKWIGTVALCTHTQTHTKHTQNAFEKGFAEYGTYFGG